MIIRLKSEQDGQRMFSLRWKYAQSAKEKAILKLLERVKKMSESVPDTVTTTDTPVKYPEQSPTRKDKPIHVKPVER